MRNNKYIFIIIASSMLTCMACDHKTAFRNGVYEGDSEKDLPCGYGTWTANNAKQSYCGEWKNGKEDGFGTKVNGDTTYIGYFAQGKYSGLGELTVKDKIVYSGAWLNGKKQGKGHSTDIQKQNIIGTWNADTLTNGTRIDSTGVYIGQLNRRGLAEGHGRYTSNTGSVYEGHWTDDKRNGFGFSISPRHQLKAGEWQADKFRGERVVYTSERIYGIDISKYQHIIGKHKYPIRWDMVRISGLGKLSKKRINGNVYYPVSFVYIKSTEGTTIRSQYFKSDYRQARANGIHVGAYHFFSTKSGATAQANFFLKNTNFSKGDFPPVLDVEPLPSQIKAMGGPEVMWNSIRTWMHIVESRTHVRPILYISQSFVNNYLPLAPDIKKNYQVWIARYGEYKPDVKLVYWQLCPDGRVNGIKGEVDINVFNGFKTQFEEFKNTYSFK